MNKDLKIFWIMLMVLMIFGMAMCGIMTENEKQKTEIENEKLKTETIE